MIREADGANLERNPLKVGLRLGQRTFGNSGYPDLYKIGFTNICCRKKVLVAIKDNSTHRINYCFKIKVINVLRVKKKVLFFS